MVCPEYLHHTQVRWTSVTRTIPTIYNNLITLCTLCALCLAFTSGQFIEVTSRRVHNVPTGIPDGMYFLCLMIIYDQPAILSLSF
jgi:hypothetical protein